MVLRRFFVFSYILYIFAKNEITMKRIFRVKDDYFVAKTLADLEYQITEYYKCYSLSDILRNGDTITYLGDVKEPIL